MGKFACTYINGFLLGSILWEVVIIKAFKHGLIVACMNLKNIAKLIGCVLLCELAGIVGALFTIQSIPTWYAALNKPLFTPPNQVFSPVWTALYALMGVSLFIVLEEYQRAKDKWETQEALQIFAGQLLLNSAWTIVFFGFQSPVAALVIVAFLWAAIVQTILRFHKISSTAAYLLAPYIVWVTFAVVLNFFIVILN